MHIGNVRSRARIVTLITCLGIGLLAVRHGASTLAAADTSPENTVKRFDLSADVASRSLKQFSEQAGVQVLFPTDLVNGIRTNAVRGDFTPARALEQMVAGTELRVVRDERTGALGIKRNDYPNAQRAAQTAQSARPAETNGTETGTVEGRVSNVQTGGYIGNARITVEGTDLETFTNPFGAFRLSGVPAGAAALKVFYTGQAPLSKTVNVIPGQIAQVELTFGQTGDKDVVELSAFSVVANKETDARAIAINEQRFAPNIKNVVSTDEFGVITEGNVGEFVRFVPGINVEYDAADPRSISIRGLPDFYSSVTIDGNRVASSASSAVSRKTELEQISTNSLSRVEVVKVPTPDMSATALGGAVNLVSRTAFERTRSQFTYRAAISANHEQLTLDKKEGPAREPTRRLMPNFDFNYVHPVSRNFGYTVNGLYSKQFVIQYNVAPGWAPNNQTQAGIPVENPYLRIVDLQNSVKATIRKSGSARLDWRWRESHVFSFDIQYNTYDTNFDGNNLIFDTNNAPVSWGPGFTQGRAAQGVIRFTGNRRHKFGEMVMPALTYRFEGRDWKVDAAASYSRSRGHYRDLPEGFNNNFNIRLFNQTVRYENITSPTSLRVVSNDDYTKLANFRLLSANQSIEDAYDVMRGAKVNVTHKAGRLPLTLKAGVAVDQNIRDIREQGRTRTYLGPDGIANNADNTAAPFVRLGKSNEPSPYDFPRIEWPSVYLTGDRYYSNPEQFVTDQAAAIASDADASKFIEETITAGFLRGDSKFMQNRLWLVYGARYERTEDSGQGRLVDPNAIYQRNANGGFALNAAGSRILLTNNPAEQARLINQDRAARTSKTYDGVYPSLNATYNFSENLIGRIGFARSLGRPDYSNIVPGTVVTPPGQSSARPNGLLELNNAALVPWTANSYDLSIEYYLNPNGILSAGVFRKDFENFFSTRTFTPSDAELSALGLDPGVYSGYDVTTKFNGGAARLTGLDLNYSQRLTFLPTWARGVSVFANTTLLDVDGSSEADFSKFASMIVNWGVAYNARKVGMNVKWNYRGQQRQTLVTSANIAPGTTEYLKPRLQCDVDVSYTFRPWLSVFAAGRNINQGRLLTMRYAPGTPDYARISSWRDFGVLLTLGVKGQF